MFIPGELELIQLINAFSGQHPAIDEIFLRSSRLDSVRMLLPVGLIWYVWFDRPENRRPVLYGLLGAVLAMVVSRGLQNLLPHRPRPSLSGEFDFTLPAGAFVNDWSSFPSDTAALSIALATIVWLGSRRLGLLALAWALVFAIFPRLYGGYHYLSDLLGGGLIGAGSVLLMHVMRAKLARPVSAAVQFSERRAGLFYLLAFAVMFQLVTFFEDVRTLASVAARLF